MTKKLGHEEKLFVPSHPNCIAISPFRVCTLGPLISPFDRR